MASIESMNTTATAEESTTVFPATEDLPADQGDTASCAESGTTAGAETEFEDFELDDIEIIESKVFA